MILLDLNQVMISNIAVQLKNHAGELNEDLIRHMVLNSIRSYNRQFRNAFGEMVICCDNKDYWRKQVFPHYKASRKTSREESPLDWNLIFGTIHKLKAEIRENLGYRVIEIPHAEADDIIATLAVMMCRKERVLILSSDKDFMQLQKYPNIEQFSPILKKFISTEDPNAFLQEHILRGDVSDGVPNFLSSDDTFVSGSRQKRLAKDKLVEWINTDPKTIINSPLGYGYSRNAALIDLSQIPVEISNAIVSEFSNQKRTHDKMRVLNYFIAKDLKSLTSKLEDF